MEPPITAVTEFWNGTTWTEVADLGTARRQSSGSCVDVLALASGGYTTTQVANTEEFTSPMLVNQKVEGQLYFNSTTNTFKETIVDLAGATWASGGNMNTGREELGGAGTQTFGLAIAGQLPSSFSPRSRRETEEYNGTAWTEKGDINNGRSLIGAGGPYTSAVIAGGYDQDSPAGKRDEAETWDGSSWSEVSELNTSRYGPGGAATSNTAGLIFGGATDPATAVTEKWNGASWTEVSDLNNARRELAGGGTQTAAMAFGGRNPPSTVDYAETWDGVSWTEESDLNTGRYFTAGGVASLTDAACFGGHSPNLANMETWNGASWTERADLSTGRRALGGANQAPASASLAFGGLGSGPIEAASEEFTAGLGNKTITAS